MAVFPKVYMEAIYLKVFISFCFSLNTNDRHDKRCAANDVDKTGQLMTNEGSQRGEQEHTQHDFLAHRGAKCACRRLLYH